MLENDHAEREAVALAPAKSELAPFKGGTMQCVRDDAGCTGLVLKVVLPLAVSGLGG